MLPPAKGSPSLNIQPPHRHGHAPARRKPWVACPPVCFSLTAAFLDPALLFGVVAPQRLGPPPVLLLAHAHRTTHTFRLELKNRSRMLGSGSRASPAAADASDHRMV